jgi:hypothetical protein
LVSTFAVTACGVPERPWLRTYTAEVQTLCPASQAADPVSGTFDGDLLATGDKAWLVATDGHRLHVAWPQGFTLSFQPGPTLRNEKGVVVAEKDTPVILVQVNRSDHEGTMEDPYLALGWLFDSCYAEAN